MKNTLILDMDNNASCECIQQLADNTNRVFVEMYSIFYEAPTFNLIAGSVNTQLNYTKEDNVYKLMLPDTISQYDAFKLSVSDKPLSRNTEINFKCSNLKSNGNMLLKKENGYYLLVAKEAYNTATTQEVRQLIKENTAQIMNDVRALIKNETKAIMTSVDDKIRNETILIMAAVDNKIIENEVKVKNYDMLTAPLAPGYHDIKLTVPSGKQILGILLNGWQPSQSWDTTLNVSFIGINGNVATVHIVGNRTQQYGFRYTVIYR